MFSITSSISTTSEATSKNWGKSITTLCYYLEVIEVLDENAEKWEHHLVDPHAHKGRENLASESSTDPKEKALRNRIGI